MENTGLLRTTKFGGFEKSDVLNYIDRIDSEKRELELKLKEALENVNPVFDDGESEKLRVEVAELNNKIAAKDSDIQSMEQSAAEQKEFYEGQIAKLNEMLENSGSSATETDALIEQIKMRDESIAEKDETIAELERQISQLKSDCENKDSKIIGLNSEIEELKLNQGGGQGAIDMGTMFAEAQKTVNKLTLEAKNNADKVVKEAEEKAESTISEAEEKAERTISDAEEKAERIISEAEEKAADTISNAEKDAAQKTADIERQSKAVSDITDSIKNLLSEKLNAVSESLAQAEKNISDAVKSVSETYENVQSDTTVEDMLNDIPKVENTYQPVSDYATQPEVTDLEDVPANDDYDDIPEVPQFESIGKMNSSDEPQSFDVPEMPKKKVFDLSDLEDL